MGDLRLQVPNEIDRFRSLTVELHVHLRIYFDFIEIFHRMQRVSR